WQRPTHNRRPDSPPPCGEGWGDSRPSMFCNPPHPVPPPLWARDKEGGTQKVDGWLCEIPPTPPRKERPVGACGQGAAPSTISSSRVGAAGERLTRHRPLALTVMPKPDPPP